MQELRITYVQLPDGSGHALGPPAVLLSDEGARVTVVVRTNESQARAVHAAAVKDPDPEASVYDLVAYLLQVDDRNPQSLVLHISATAGRARIDWDGGFSVPCSAADGLAVAARLQLPIFADHLHARELPALDQVAYPPEAVSVETLYPLALPVPAPDEAVAWLREHAQPLVTCMPGASRDDLRCVDELVRNARIVGLGEGTHGTREFFLMKHRLLEYLVEDHGFTLFAMEAPVADALTVDAYVRGGDADPEEITSSLVFESYQTEELRDVIMWMRSYNDRTEGAPLRFVGFDMQNYMGIVRYLGSYFSAVDPEYLEEWRRDRFGMPVVLARVEQHESVYVERSSPEAWRWARFVAQVGVQSEEEMREDENTGLFREWGMADNIRAHLEMHPVHSKMVVWAHNGHVCRQPGSGGGWMGWHLDRLFGNTYVNIAMLFNEGSFQAYGHQMRDWALGPAPVGTLEDALARTGVELTYVRLPRPDESSPVGQWLASKPPHRAIGAAFDRPAYKANDPSVLHDALIFVARTTAARRL